MDPKNYDFVIHEDPMDVHDYFLQEGILAKGDRYFCAKLLKKNKSKMILYFVLLPDGQAVSLKNTPFGGFWVEKKVSSEAVQYFLEELIIGLKSLSCRSFKLVQAPDLYESNNPLIHYILSSMGFVLKGMLLHQFLEDRKIIKGLLMAKIPKHKKKMKKLGYTTELGSIENFNFLKDVKQWRKIRGHEYNVKEESLINQISSFPDRYFLISIYQDGIPVSHVLCVKLTSNSLYYYLPAINPHIQVAYSGEAMILEVIQLGDSLGVDFIDFGSSDLDGEANHSLIRFKSKFANANANKLTWVLEL
ncbi:GNAT family N-acetyltransferase [Echinicola shivajiensis]|uniref:GNAT family N-acetyltransferase n=1 Tax=Echinicola shivajiensis TaxID=1035916 RepID=UPI001BFC37C2|nr:GNAT family N-acetyltransferase [Echinicola shivajiensis]